MALTNSNPFNINVVSWSPPYSLPAVGQVSTIGASSGAGSLAAAMATTTMPGGFNYNYSFFNSYGAGVVVEDCSAGGAYVLAGTGGHDHADFTGACLFDFADATWKAFDHQNGGPRYSSNTNTYGFNDSALTGDPWWEVTGTNGLGGDFAVPAPPHPYQALSVIPTANGGGPKGSVIYVGRSAIGHTGQQASQRVHRLDLDTMRWRRVPTATLARVSYENSIIFDAARNRYWHLPSGANSPQYNFQNIEYLDGNDWTVKYTSSFGWPDVRVGDAYSRIFMYQGYLIIQGASNSLWAFNPDNASAGFTQLSVSGSGSLPSRVNKFAHFVPNNKFYCISQNGGNTLNRLTPPASNPLTNTWVADTVTLPTSLPALDTTADPGGASEQYHFLFYVPSIQRLAWIPGGARQVYLINPT